MWIFGGPALVHSVPMRIAVSLRAVAFAKTTNGDAVGESGLRDAPNHGRLARPGAFQSAIKSGRTSFRRAKWLALSFRLGDLGCLRTTCTTSTIVQLSEP